MASIYDLSWGETSFPAKVYLLVKAHLAARPRLRSEDLKERASAYSALSSTYYSILGTAVAQFRAAAALRPWLLAPVKVALWCTSWLPLAAWCYWRMLPLSDAALTILGYEGMTPAQLDVRQSILRRRGKYAEAGYCISAALAKGPERAHTRGLLQVGLAEIARHDGQRQVATAALRSALIEARVAETQDLWQASRIYRHCVEIADWLGQESPAPAAKLHEKARTLALAADARDQLLKLQ